VKQHRPDGDRATVEFVARSRVGGGSAQRLHELSRFVREDGRWFYVDGDIRD
jgi:SEC-C motif-containing protein